MPELELITLVAEVKMYELTSTRSGFVARIAVGRKCSNDGVGVRWTLGRVVFREREERGT
jgi:hypothetical protein